MEIKEVIKIIEQKNKAIRNTLKKDGWSKLEVNGWILGQAIIYSKTKCPNLTSELEEMYLNEGVI